MPGTDGGPDAREGDVVKPDVGLVPTKDTGLSESDAAAAPDTAGGGCNPACGSGQACVRGLCIPINTGGGTCPPLPSCPNGLGCGCYLVPGLGANKRALLDAGASRYMLASAMMETDNMTTSYSYGDGKTGDSWNGGVAKQNWYMMRQCHPAWQTLDKTSYDTGAAVNSNLQLDVQVYDECRAFFLDLWWAGHRYGSKGLQDPNTQDIMNFKAAMDWTNDRLAADASHLTDDVRFWVKVRGK